MSLEELKAKYPFLRGCIEVHNGMEYLNPKLVRKHLNEELSSDLEQYQGLMLLDSYDSKLNRDEELIFG